MNDWDDDAVGAELRRLFGDERLDVRPAPDADRAIVSGARRRRRRRARPARARERWSCWGWSAVVWR
ncbi:hypothetical protein ACFSVJ_14720 [Prauserella oleivorans]